MAKPNISINAIGNAVRISGVARATSQALPTLRQEIRLLRYAAPASLIVSFIAALAWLAGGWMGNGHVQALALWTAVLAGLVFTALLGILLGALALDALNLCCGWNLGRPAKGKTGTR